MRDPKKKIEYKVPEEASPIQFNVKAYVDSLNDQMAKLKIPFTCKNIAGLMQNEINYQNAYIAELEKEIEKYVEEGENEFIEEYAEAAYEKLSWGKYEDEEWIKVSDLRWEFIDIFTKQKCEKAETITFPTTLEIQIVDYFLDTYDNILLKVDGGEKYIQNLNKGLPNPGLLDSKLHNPLKGMEDTINNYLNREDE